MSGKSRIGRKRITQIIASLIGLVLIGGAVLVYPAARDLYKAGMFDQTSDRKYNGNTVDDLKAIRTALMLYHDSEGQFPDAGHWMEAIEKRIRTDDMPGSEAEKKLIDPVYAGQVGKYGFALNDAASNKYKGDIKDPKTPLVFESQDPSKDAHGDPSKLAPKPPHAGGNLAIAVDGTILHLPG
jgi:hypothetical protein